MPIEKIITSFTKQQIQWLNEHTSRTGLNRAEILRRAIDSYRELMDKKRETALFSPEQVRDLQTIAGREGKTERDVAKEAISLGLRLRKNR